MFFGNRSQNHNGGGVSFQRLPIVWEIATGLFFGLRFFPDSPNSRPGGTRQGRQLSSTRAGPGRLTQNGNQRTRLLRGLERDLRARIPVGATWPGGRGRPGQRNAGLSNLCSRASWALIPSFLPGPTGTCPRKHELVAAAGEESTKTPGYGIKTDPNFFFPLGWVVGHQGEAGQGRLSLCWVIHDGTRVWARLQGTREKSVTSVGQ